jgi:hypothetical protein
VVLHVLCSDIRPRHDRLRGGVAVHKDTHRRFRLSVRLVHVVVPPLTFMFPCGGCVREFSGL